MATNHPDDPPVQPRTTPSKKKTSRRKDTPKVVNSKTPLVSEDPESGQEYRVVTHTPVPLSSRWSLFCPFLSAKNTLLFCLCCMGLVVAIQGTLSMVVGPHYIGLACALVLAIFVFIGLGRTASSICRIPMNCCVRVSWFLLTFMMFVLCILFLAIYLMTIANFPQTIGFPSHCTHPETCVRVMSNTSLNHNAGNLTVPLFDLPPDRILELLERWLSTETYQVNVIEGINPATGIIHSRWVSTFFGFIDDLYLQIEATPVGLYAVDIHSESRIGHYDFGENKRRVEIFLAQVNPGPPSRKKIQTAYLKG